MSYQILSLSDFLKNEQQYPIIDVRSEGEFVQGHIPTAFNLPLLNNEERKEIGITYKKSGSEKAVEKGFDLVGHKFGDYIRAAKKIIKEHNSAFQPQTSELRPSRTILLYCWRGGMRSNIMAWILSMAGIKVYLLKGGYKIFRHWVLETLEIPKKIVVLGGMTGSGKTEILQYLADMGEQIIDLEKLARHKGSSYGALGQQPQPRNEHFENMLAWEWTRCNQEKVLWLEDESRQIGSIKIPDTIYQHIRTATVIELVVPVETRIKRILHEYGIFPVEQLIENTKKLQKRLGNQRLTEAIHFLKQNDLESWVKIVLVYYDKTYSFGLSQREMKNIYRVEITSENYEENAKKVKAFLKF